MRPWHIGFPTLNDFSSLFLASTFSGFESVTNNPDFCHRMQHFGLASRIESMLTKWHPKTEEGDFRNAPQIPIYPLILASSTPNITLNLLKDHAPLLNLIISFQPCDIRAEWPHSLWTHLMSHASLTCFSYPSQPTSYCRTLVKYILLSARVHQGSVAAFLAVYLSSFCEHCRRLLVEGVGDDLKYPQREVKTGLDLMVSRAVTFTDFAVLVFSWFLEPSWRFEQWLSTFQDKLSDKGLLAQLGLQKRVNLRHFFYDISDSIIQASLNLLLPNLAWNHTLPGEIRSVWDTLSTVSQAPTLISDNILKITHFIISLVCSFGYPRHALSVFYHASCYLDHELTSILASMMIKIDRSEFGGRKIEYSLSLPCKIIESISVDDHDGHQEDALTLCTESLLSLLGESNTRDYIFILGRLLANLSYHNIPLRRILQRSQHVPYILGHSMTHLISIGEQAALLCLAFEIFGSYSSQWITRQLPPSIAKPMLSVLDIIPLLTESGQPWWQAAEIFLLRSLFKRSMPLILGLHHQGDESPIAGFDADLPNIQELHIENDSSNKKSYSLPTTTTTRTTITTRTTVTLDQKQEDTILALIDTVFLLSLSQDITTREAAFETIYDALNAPKDLIPALNIPIDLISDPSSFLSPLHMAVSREVARITVRRIKERYEDRFKAAAEIEHFGFSSKSERAFGRYKIIKYSI